MDTQERKIYIALLLAAIIPITVFIIYIVSLIKQRRKNLSLYKDKVSAEIIMLENERKRFVKDLHDDFGPILSAIKLQVSSITTHSAQEQRVQVKTIGLINQLLKHIHHVANNLMPNELERKGLIVAIKQFADDINIAGKVNVNMHVASDFPAVTKDKEIHIYRIVQEAIGNALKHSKADQLEISFKAFPRHIRVSISDNGVGYDHRRLSGADSAGLGLTNILSRVELLGGDIFIDSDTGKGTMYTITIPNSIAI